MTFSRIAASLIALGLFAGPSLAAPAGPVPLVLAKAQIVPPAVQALLQDNRSPAELSDEELTKRIRRTRQLSQLPDLPADVARQLRDMNKAATAELAERQSASGGMAGMSAGQQPSDDGAGNGQTGNGNAGNGKAGNGNASNGKAGNGNASNGNASNGKAGKPAVAQAAEVPAEVVTYLADSRPASELAPAALRTRIETGRTLAGLPGLAPKFAKRIAARVAEDQAALKMRQAQAQAQSGDGNASSTDTTNNANSTAHGTNMGNIQIVSQYLNDTRAPAQMSSADLKAKIAQGEDILRRNNLPPNLRQQVLVLQQSLKAELASRQAAGSGSGNTQNQPANNTGGQSGNNAGSGQTANNGGQSSGNAGTAGMVDPAAESQAKNILSDARPAQTMNIEALRNRVNAMRALMQQNRNSKDTRARLYQKLVADRTVLRTRMAAVIGQTNNGQVANNNNGNTNTNNNNNPPANNGNAGAGGKIEPYLLDRYRHDRRPPRDLNDDELRLRINVYVNILASNAYPDNRGDWQQRLDFDRRILRERMLEERARRQAELRAQRDRIILDQQRAQYDDLAAAEASDSELEDMLAARPRRTIEHRVTLDDLENDADLRAALPRIEIDTIHFGFNESFVREEEVNNLDRVAQVMERILASNPDEVFLIEGHTDASGSDAYNLGLSRLRAEAVKTALSTYYVIPAQSLRTVGYGERFLKIPVDGPEPENRRVSVSRITDVVSRN